jgi:putative ABC transport system permease protein
MVDASVVDLQDSIVGPARPVLWTLLGAVVFLLFVVCANVLNLLLARAAGRSREVALCLALGAGRGRVARQLVIETALLAAGAGGIALLIAAWCTRVVRLLAPQGLPRIDELAVGWPIVWFAIGMSVLVTGVIGGLAAHRALASAGHAALRQEPGAARRVSSPRLRASLVVIQIAMTLILLIGTGLVSRSVRHLLDTAPGFRTAGVAAVTLYQPPIPASSVFDPPGAADADKMQRVRALNDVAARLRAVRDITEVGIVDAMPLTGETASGTFGMFHDDREVDQLLQDVRGGKLDSVRALFNDPSRTGGAGYRAASRGYFAAMGIPLIHGRLFEERDTLDAPHVALISATLAKTRWPDRDPIGQRIEFGNMDGDLRPLTIVGIVGDVRDVGLDQSPRAIVYTCYAQRPARTFSLVVYSRAGSESVLASLGSAVRTAAPSVPTRVVSIETIVGTWLQWREFVLLVLAFFGGTALLLAVMGVYAALSYAVTQQQREIGIRLALGERPRGVLLMVIRRATLLTSAGVALGGFAALASARALSTVLFEVTPTDPVTYIGIAALLFAVAVLASWLPARRAARLDVIVALRAE